MMNEHWYASLDQWKTTEPPESKPSWIAYRCLECDWTGKGGLAAMVHHRVSRHHRMIARDAPQWPLQFACCQVLAAPNAD